jgi:hypothetical protein
MGKSSIQLLDSGEKKLYYLGYLPVVTKVKFEC